jgi:hypothetical protein
MRRAPLLIAVALAGATSATGTASAGTYEVSACSATTPPVNNSWAPFNSDTTYLETSSDCGGSDMTGGSATTSGLAAADVLRLMTNVPAGAMAGWRFTAPAGDTISTISMDRDLYDQSEGWAPQIVDADGTPLPNETCPSNASNGGCEASGAVVHTGLDTSSLAIELLCHPEPVQLTACANGFSEHDARVELNGAAVTVVDEQPPRVVSLSGSLFAGGLVRGVISGTIAGADSSGVHEAGIYVDGSQIAQQAYACNFTQPAPCPASSSSQFSLDTSTLSNGPHQIQAVLVDAAGNKTLSSPVQVITVQNTSPSAPSGLQVNGKGAGAWINQPVTIAWTNPTQLAGDPISQINWVACRGIQTSIPASGCEAEQQSSPLSSLAFDPAQTAIFAGQPQGSYTVFVWLQDALGNTTQANAAAISFGYQTTPPAPPTSIVASGRGPYAIMLGAPADIAPLAATNWTVCDAKGICTPILTSPGLSFGFDPVHTPQFQRDPYGRFTVRAWLQDAAGNTSPANSATLTITRPRPGRPSPQLHILSVTRIGPWLRVRGSAARALRGLVAVVVRYTLGTRTRSAQKTVCVMHGTWAAILRLPDGARTARVTIVRHSSKAWLAQTVTRYIRRRVAAGR